MQGSTPPNRLRELRNRRALPQAVLAEEIGVHESTVSRWENGESSIPDARKQQLAEFFSVTVSQLMGWDEPNGNGDGVKAAA